MEGVCATHLLPTHAGRLPILRPVDARLMLLGDDARWRGEEHYLCDVSGEMCKDEDHVDDIRKVMTS